MIHFEPVTLEGYRLRIEPLSLEHHYELATEWPDAKRHLELRLARHELPKHDFQCSDHCKAAEEQGQTSIRPSSAWSFYPKRFLPRIYP